MTAVLEYGVDLFNVEGMKNAQAFRGAAGEHGGG